MSLKTTIENNDTKSGRIFDLFIQSLIVLSLISFSIETLPDLSHQSRIYLRVFEIICVVIFSIEYILRLIVADKKLKFIFSFYGLIDLFAILPFYISTGIDLRSIRVFRILRIFRALKLFRYSKAIIRLKKSFISIKTELVLFFISTVFLLYISALGIYYFERDAQPETFSSIFDSLWWAVATLTTVGYGDIYPITTGGRIFTFIILMIGLGIVAIPTGLFASALTKIDAEEG